MRQPYWRAVRSVRYHSIQEIFYQSDFNWKVIPSNRNTRSVENELVQETTWRALKTVKPLTQGHSGTFDHDEREPVPDDGTLLVQQTL